MTCRMCLKFHPWYYSSHCYKISLTSILLNIRGMMRPNITNFTSSHLVLLLFFLWYNLGACNQWRVAIISPTYLLFFSYSCLTILVLTNWFVFYITLSKHIILMCQMQVLSATPCAKDPGPLECLLMSAGAVVVSATSHLLRDPWLLVHWSRPALTYVSWSQPALLYISWSCPMSWM